MSDISFSPGGMPRDTIDSQARKPGLAAFHTFDEQKEESSSRSKLIAGVAVVVMFAAVGGYAYEASGSRAPVHPSASAAAPQSVATTPPVAAPAPSAPAPNAPATDNVAPANDVAAPVVAPAPVVTPRPAPVHARVVHTAPARGASGGADDAMQNRMSHASDNAPANIAPAAPTTLTPDVVAPAPAPTPAAPANASPSTPAPTTVSPATPAPAQSAPPTTPNPNTQTPAPSDDPSTN